MMILDKLININREIAAAHTHAPSLNLHHIMARISSLSPFLHKSPMRFSLFVAPFANQCNKPYLLHQKNPDFFEDSVLFVVCAVRMRRLKRQGRYQLLPALPLPRRDEVRQG